MSMELDRKCLKCGSIVKQRVFFEDEDGRITIQVCKTSAHSAEAF